MKVEIETRHDIGDVVWVAGRRFDEQLNRMVIAPVRCEVEQIYMSLHSKEHKWMVEYLVQQSGEPHLACLGYGSNDDGSSPDATYPIYARKEFGTQMYASEQACWDSINEDPFD